MVTFAANFWTYSNDQIKQRLPGHNLIHFGQELLLLGVFFSHALLVIGKIKLLTNHHPSPGLDLCHQSRVDSLGFLEFP